jgi:hypothetical protein
MIPVKRRGSLPIRGHSRNCWGRYLASVSLRPDAYGRGAAPPGIPPIANFGQVANGATLGSPRLSVRLGQRRGLFPVSTRRQSRDSPMPQRQHRRMVPIIDWPLGMAPAESLGCRKVTRHTPDPLPKPGRPVPPRPRPAGMRASCRFWSSHHTGNATTDKPDVWRSSLRFRRG